MRKILIFLMPFISSCSIFGVNDTEQMEYEVLLSDGKKEIRLYKPFIKAQVEMVGSIDQTRNDSFKILAGYIFGKNEQKSKIAMTSPVVANDERLETQKIAMTSPVVMNQDQDKTQMFFKMPSEYTLESLPRPIDKRIEISPESEKIYAVITYSGSWSKGDFIKKEKELKKWVTGLGQYKVNSTSKYAGYNPPWTLPWFRKNEVLLEISK